MAMDWILCFFDMSSSATFELKGVKTVKVRTTGNEKLWFSVVLTAVVSKVDNQYKAITLPPMIIFENLSKARKGTFPKVMVIKGTKGGTMKRSIAKSCCRLEFGKKECGCIQWKNYYQKLHLRLRDIILNWAVQIETILDVNEMLLDLQEATMDAVN